MEIGSVKDSRVDVYLGVNSKDNDYKNTNEETELVHKWHIKY
jgi:hypothetical protein